MTNSLIDIQRDLFLNHFRAVAAQDRSQWRILITDETSRKLLDNVVKEDDVLNENITHIELLESRRQPSRDMEALYLLSPEPHVVDILMSDFENRRYKASHILWTARKLEEHGSHGTELTVAVLNSQQSRRISNSRMAQDHIRSSRTLSIDFYPRESHVVTFRDPYSFPILYHPECNSLVKDHFQALASKIKGVCIALEEYPTIRYFRPQHSRHDASVLCSHLARFVQEELDMYKNYHPDFGTQTSRPPGVLFVVDRSLDLYGPLLHEFTYQAMAHDLMPIKEGDKVTYRMKVNEGQADEESKDVELNEADKIWVENRHRHMQDTTQKLETDFNKFIRDNANFTQSDSSAPVKLNAIKDMLADLPEFQTLKEAYSLHLTLVSGCMALLPDRKMLDVALVEQALATGLDETGQKLRNIAEELISLLDDSGVVPQDRLRLIMLYLVYRDGVVEADVTKLLAHSQLPPSDLRTIVNMTHLGARVLKAINEVNPSISNPPVFQPRRPDGDVPAVSRFQPALKTLLEEHISGLLDKNTFPSLSATGHTELQDAQIQASLRTASKPQWANPQWASSRLKAIAPKQRIIVFVAGGATFAEARACYEISEQTSRDVFLATSHMLYPSFYIRQLSDLGVERRRLNVPPDRPKPRAPAHFFESETSSSPPPPKTSAPKPAPPPVSSMASLNISGRHPARPSSAASANRPSSGQSSEQTKPDKDEKKKKHYFFSSKR